MATFLSVITAFYFTRLSLRVVIVATLTRNISSQCDSDRKMNMNCKIVYVVSIHHG